MVTRWIYDRPHRNLCLFDWKKMMIHKNCFSDLLQFNRRKKRIQTEIDELMSFLFFCTIDQSVAVFLTLILKSRQRI